MTITYFSGGGGVINFKGGVGNFLLDYKMFFLNKTFWFEKRSYKPPLDIMETFPSEDPHANINPYASGAQQTELTVKYQGY